MAYFRHNLRHYLATNNRIPQIYGMPKVHKIAATVPFRPVNSQCGSVFALASIFIDVHLQLFIPTCPAYLRDSDAFLVMQARTK